MPLAELSRIVYFRGDTLPPDLPRELMQTRHFITKEYPFAFTNGVQACWLEVDADTGMVQLLKHWCVEDCGRVINPMLVDEQVRGGIVQGLGGALYEHCVYSPEGQLLVGSMADYLVPMAMEMPDIEVGHVETPTKESLLGAKGAGEAGTAGAPAAVMNAINDALRPFGAKVFAQPFTPERILAALGKVPARWPEQSAASPSTTRTTPATANAAPARRSRVLLRQSPRAKPPRPHVRPQDRRLGSVPRDAKALPPPVPRRARERLGRTNVPCAEAIIHRRTCERMRYGGQTLSRNGRGVWLPFGCTGHPDGAGLGRRMSCGLGTCAASAVRAPLP